MSFIETCIVGCIIIFLVLCVVLEVKGEIEKAELAHTVQVELAEPDAKDADENEPVPTGRWVSIRVMATAYSPGDKIDRRYRATKGKWKYKTADGVTDVRVTPYGVASPRIVNSYGVKEYAIPLGTYVYLPEYQSGAVVKIDDTGGRISKLTRTTGVLTIDLRFKTESEAVEWAGAAGKREVEMRIWEEQ